MEILKAISGESINALSKLLSKRKLAVMVGSGISVDSGLPSWDELLLSFLIFCSKQFKIYPGMIDPELIANTDLSIEKVRDTLKNKKSFQNLLDTISVFRDYLTKLPESQVTDNFRDWFYSEFAGKKPNINHEYIVAADFNIILTTNYDRLLYQAAIDNGYSNLAVNTYDMSSYKTVAKHIYEENDFIFNIHGKYTDIALRDVVFTKKDYYKVMKENPSLRMILETIFIKYPILFVGYGMSDPHLEDLVEEISFSYNYSEENVRKFFIVVKQDKIDFVKKRIKEMQGVTLLGIDEYSEVTELLKSLSTLHPRSKS